MKNFRRTSLNIVIVLILLPLFISTVKAATIEDSSYGINEGDVLAYNIVINPDPESIGNKMLYKIESIFRGNSCDVPLTTPLGWYGAAINVSMGTWNKTTGISSYQNTILTALRYNETLKYFEAHCSWLYVIPTPVNLTFIAECFNNKPGADNYTASVSDAGTTLNLYVEWNGSPSHIMNYTYNENGVATRWIYNHSSVDAYQVWELDVTFSGGNNGIPLGNSFIGIVCVSVFALVIIIKKRKNVKWQY